MDLPKRDLVTRGEVRAWLGIGNSTFDKLVRNGVLRRVVLPGCSHGKYVRAEVVGCLKSALNESGVCEEK